MADIAILCFLASSTVAFALAFPRLNKAGRLARLAGRQPFHAGTFAGGRFDCGNKLGFVEATLALALEREDMGADVRAIAERLLG